MSAFDDAVRVWERVPRVEENMEVDDASRAAFAAARAEMRKLREALTAARDWLDDVFPDALEGKLLATLNSALLEEDE